MLPLRHNYSLSEAISTNASSREYFYFLLVISAKDQGSFFVTEQRLPRVLIEPLIRPCSGFGPEPPPTRQCKAHTRPQKNPAR
jgi:hypothetical protein